MLCTAFENSLRSLLAKRALHGAGRGHRPGYNEQGGYYVDLAGFAARAQDPGDEHQSAAPKSPTAALIGSQLHCSLVQPVWTAALGSRAPEGWR